MSYYNKNVIEDIDSSILLNRSFDEWFLIVEEVLLHDEFQKRKLFAHHHDMTVWDHSIFVSFKAFLVAKYFGADQRVCALAGLLHDFYPQAWLYNAELEKLENGKYLKEYNVKKPLFKMHGFIHASEAALNYVKYFPWLEDERITNAIKRHMFPLNIVPPKYKEGYIVTMIDKWNSVHELPSITVVPKNMKKKALKILFKKV